MTTIQYFLEAAAEEIEIDEDLRPDVQGLGSLGKQWCRLGNLQLMQINIWEKEQHMANYKTTSVVV